MIKLTDTDGDPILISPEFITAVVKYRMPPEQKAGMTERDFNNSPKTVIVSGSGSLIAVMEDFDIVHQKIKLGDI